MSVLSLWIWIDEIVEGGSRRQLESQLEEWQLRVSV